VGDWLPDAGKDRATDFGRTARQTLRDREGVGAGHPDDGDATAPGRGGDRGDGVARKRHVT